MALYYITGTPGAGKSTVLAELKRRNFTAYETDDLAAFYDTRTGRKSPWVPAAERTPEWRRYHQWKIPPEKVDTLAAETASQTAFLCGVTGNDTEFWDRFARVFCLYVPPAEVERRLIARTDEDAHGKNAHELATTLEWAATARQQYIDLGATIIDAMEPPEKVVAGILELIEKDG